MPRAPNDGMNGLISSGSRTTEVIELSQIVHILIGFEHKFLIGYAGLSKGRSG
jgi:hypothetical protein